MFITAGVRHTASNVPNLTMPISPIRWKSQFRRRCEPCFSHRCQFVVASARRLNPAALPNPVPRRLITIAPLVVSRLFSAKGGGRMEIQLILREA